MSKTLSEAAAPIIQTLNRVESGDTRGAGGSYHAAPGGGKLVDVHIAVEHLRELRDAAAAATEADRTGYDLEGRPTSPSNTAFRAAFGKIVEAAIEARNTFDCIGHRRTMSQGEVLAMIKLNDFLEYHGARETLASEEDEDHAE